MALLTLVTFDLDGVPKGQEEQIQAALDSYYIRGYVSMRLTLLTAASKLWG